MEKDIIIDIAGLQNCFQGQWVHRDVNLQIQRGEIIAIIGGSGCGKTTIIRSVLMLQKPTAGTIKVFGTDIANLDSAQNDALRRRWGMLFQQSALFSSMTVIENIMYPITEFTQLDSSFAQELALLKMAFVGLPKTAAHKYPSELSGGMQRRAAAARALAMDPELLFLDEPTTGLDPRGARQFDELILFLRKALALTVVMVSHDLQSIKGTTDRVAFIGEGKVLALEPIESLMENKHPMIAEYFGTL